MSEAEEYKFNPIASVDGKAVPCPSSYSWSLQDLSESDAGRTEDGTMDKQLIGQCVKIELAWNYVDSETAAAVLNAFNPEYFTVKYYDAKDKVYREAEFYAGDRSAPLYSQRLGLWKSIKFNIIERKCRKVEG